MWPVAVDRIHGELDGECTNVSPRGQKKWPRGNNEMTVRRGCTFSFFSRKHPTTVLKDFTFL